jgi:hypothetical protein
MTSLADYAHLQYPNHSLREQDGTRPLADHTVVAHVFGAANIHSVLQGARSDPTGAPIGVVTLVRTEPTVVPTGGEDKDGVVDLPKRRIVTASLVVGVVVGAAVGVVVGIASGSIAIGLIVGVFALALGAIAGGMAGGGGRYAGQRAWEQRNAPDDTIGLIAAYCDGLQDASVAARRLEGFDVEEVRIVNKDGGWRAPDTWA